MRAMGIAATDAVTRRRLRLACLLVQIALVEWVVRTLFFSTSEWLYLYVHFDPTRYNIVAALGITSDVRDVLLLTAMWLFTRGLHGWVAVPGALLIFNVLLVAVLADALQYVNWLYAAVSGDVLVVEYPLRKYLRFMTQWVWYGLWLAMIVGGASIAREVNRRLDGRLLIGSRLRVLFIMALIAWCVWVFGHHYAYTVLEWVLLEWPTVSDAVYVNSSIAYGLIVNIPALVLCVMLFTAMRQVRRVLASPTLKVCPKCSHALHESNAGRCAECGWTVESA